MRFSANSAIADFMVAPGSMVVTSRPLAASMILTVIVASLRPSLAWHLYVLFPGPQIRYISISLISIPKTGVGPILPPRNLHAFALVICIAPRATAAPSRRGDRPRHPAADCAAATARSGPAGGRWFPAAGAGPV